MAQKREKEETLELKKVPTTETLPSLCPENCKIPAPSSAQPRSGPGSVSPDPIRVDPCHNAPSRAPKRPREDDAAEQPVLETSARDDDAAASIVKKKTVNRCSGCGKRVGLTGFTCRCGDMFCSVHRYSDRHDCGFDYKAAGREAIARDNPVVRAAKILKI